MLFKKKQYELTDDDARAYINFFEESTASIFMSLRMQAYQSGHKDSLGDDSILFEAFEVWHQAIAREQLMMLTSVFYGGGAVEDQIIKLLTDYERGRLDKLGEGVSFDDFIAEIENANTKLLNSENDNRYANELINLMPQLNQVIDKLVLEQTAEDLRVHTIAFWKKHGYCK